MSKKKFKAEVAKLLNLITHSLYSNKEIFIRELVSNASDAIDKRKFLALTSKAAESPSEGHIEIRFDEKEQGWISITDTGIGMDGAELEDFLGTIANSGTSTFLESMEDDAQNSSELIGQFGVGFYSAFIVGQRVVVTTRRYDNEQGYQWVSDGIGSYTISECDKKDVGTEVRIELTDAGKEFANRHKLTELVKRYSDHVSHPIFLNYHAQQYDDKGAPKGAPTAERQQVNDASALWRRQKSDLKQKDYEGFYRSISGDSEPPLLHIHIQAEGTLNYTALLFIPQKAAADLYYSEYHSGMRLYIQRVFITDDYKKLLPGYFRFVVGIIDSEDLPLNISRELLQENQLMQKIQQAIVKRLFRELQTLAEKEPQRYGNFIEQYNRLLKEGLYQDYSNRSELLKLVNYYSTKSDGMVSLAEYKERAKPEQKFIYYLTGSDISALRQSQLLERFGKKDVEVLLLADEIDEFLIPGMEPYEQLQWKSISSRDTGGAGAGAGAAGAGDASSGESDPLIDVHDAKAEGRYAGLPESIKEVLGDAVDGVQFSKRLDTSPACVVTRGDAPSARIRDLLKNYGQDNAPPKPILEINPGHEMIATLHALHAGGNKEVFADVSWLLLEQSMLVANMPLQDSPAFVQRINKLVGRVFAGDGKAAGKTTGKTAPASADKSTAARADAPGSKPSAGKTKAPDGGAASDSSKK